MFNKKSAVILAAVTVFLAGGAGFSVKAYAGDPEKQADSQQDKLQAPKQANNDICPVTGAKIDFKNPSYVTYEYNGTVYNFCCDGCIDSFQKDPEKYLKKLEEEKNSQKK